MQLNGIELRVAEATWLSCVIHWLVHVSSKRESNAMEDDADTLPFQVEEVSSRAFTFFPLPWRVALLTGVGILGWASNLQFLHFMGIDTAYVLDMHSHTNSRPFSPTSPHFDSTTLPRSGHLLYLAVYKLFGIYSAWTVGCWLLFRALCGGDTQKMDHYKIVVEVCAIGVLAALVCPFNVIRKRERDLVLQAFYRCLFSSTNQPIHFSDIVLADILTSFAKVIGDLWISACMLAPWGSLRLQPVDEGWLQWMVPCLMSLPYVIRLRQCLIEFLSSPHYSNTRALLNAIKYSTAFPVIFLSAAQRLVVSELMVEKGSEVAETPWHGEHRLFRLWLLAVAVNSVYSFWWDITNDWGLSLLQSLSGNASSVSQPRSPLPPQFSLGSSTSSVPSSQGDDHETSAARSGDISHPQTSRDTLQPYPRGLRQVLLFNDHIVYYIAMSLNLVLRLTWSLKLSSHLHSMADLEGGVFLMEALELIRRWVWVFFRVEWEAVKKGVGTVGEDGPTGEVHELDGPRRQQK